MAIEGIVNEVGVTQKGSPKLKVNGEWYYAGKCDVSSVKVGDSISMEVKSFGEAGNLWGIQKWAKLPTAPQAFLAKPSAVSGDAEQRFISNCVGQAITAGLIKTPAQITAWVLGAKRALTAEPSRDQRDDYPDDPDEEEEFDSNVPL
jgi:hypothetical protein